MSPRRVLRHIPRSPSDAPDAPDTHTPSLDELEARLAEFADTGEWTPRAGRRTLRDKSAAGVRGMKLALRGDSSFFAHAYRGLLIALTATLLGIGPQQWCLLILAGGLVLISEFCHSAVDTLARAFGDADAPGPTAAREIATAGVLVSVIIFIIVAAVVLVSRMSALYGW